MSTTSADLTIQLSVPQAGTNRLIELTEKTNLDFQFNPKAASYALDENGDLVVTFDNEGSYTLQNFSEFANDLNVSVNGYVTTLGDLVLNVADIDTAAGPNAAASGPPSSGTQGFEEGFGDVADGIGNLILSSTFNRDNGLLTNGSAPLEDVTPPKIGPVDLTSPSDSGVSDTDDLTNISNPTFSGTAEPFSIVSLYEGSTLLGTVKTTPEGTWTLTVPHLSEGTHNIFATATDAVGNVSDPDHLTITVDTTPPELSTSNEEPFEINEVASDTAVPSQPIFVGQIEATDNIDQQLSYSIEGPEAQFFNIDINGTITIDPSGWDAAEWNAFTEWSNYEPTSGNLNPTAQISTTLTVTVTDDAGNSSQQSYAVNVNAVNEYGPHFINGNTTQFDAIQEDASGLEAASHTQSFSAEQLLGHIGDADHIRDVDLDLADATITLNMSTVDGHNLGSITFSYMDNDGDTNSYNGIWVLTHQTSFFGTPIDQAGHPVNVNLSDTSISQNSSGGFDITMPQHFTGTVEMNYGFTDDFNRGGKTSATFNVTPGDDAPILTLMEDQTAVEAQSTPFELTETDAVTVMTLATFNLEEFDGAPINFKVMNKGAEDARFAVVKVGSHYELQTVEDAQFDREGADGDAFTLQVTAHDSAPGSSSSATIDIDVEVVGVNDIAPKASAPEYSDVIPTEHTAAGVVLATVGVDDGDRGEGSTAPGDFEYSFVTGPDASGNYSEYTEEHFHINDKGEISLTTAGQQFYDQQEIDDVPVQLHVQVADGSGSTALSSNVVDVNLVIEDVNEAPTAPDIDINNSLGLKASYFAFDNQTDLAPDVEWTKTNAFNYVNSHLTNEATTADATFIASKLDFNYGTGSLDTMEDLAGFIEGSGHNLTDTKPDDDFDNYTERGIIKMEGYVKLEAGAHKFKVHSDDGFEIKIDGEVVGKFYDDRSPDTSEFTFDVIDLPTTGEYHTIEITYWDQGSEYVLSIEDAVKPEGEDSYSDFTVLQGADLVHDIANVDQLVVNEVNTLTIDADFITGQASDPENDSLSVATSDAYKPTISRYMDENGTWHEVTNPSTVGSVRVNEQGDIVFKPAPNFFGDVELTYHVQDTDKVSNEANIILKVVSVNDIPEAHNVTLEPQPEMLEDGADYTFNKAELIPKMGITDVEDTDGELSITVEMVNSNQGTVVQDGDNYTLDPADDFNGRIALKVTIQDSDGASIEHKAFVDVTPVNDTPTGHDATIATIKEDTSTEFTGKELTKALEFNDVDGDELTFTFTPGQEFGGTILDSSGNILQPGDQISLTETYTFKPIAQSHDDVSFDVTASDGTRSAPNTATIVIETANDNPTLIFEVTGAEAQNLILNGSFELSSEDQALIISDGGWQGFDSIYGWTKTAVDAEDNAVPPADQMEIHHQAHAGVGAADGNNYMELGASPGTSGRSGNVGMTQTIADGKIVEGDTYQLTFSIKNKAYTVNHNSAASGELKVLWNGDEIPVSIPSGTDSEWVEVSVTVIGGPGDNSLTFFEVGVGGNNHGMAIDNISLVSTPSVTIDENVRTGVLVAQAVGSDVDGDVLSYSFANGTQEQDGFVIDASSGEIKVANGTHDAFDVDAPGTQTSYTLQVVVNDGHGGTNPQPITINIADTEEYAPTIDAVASQAIAEGTYDNAIITTVHADDFDQSDSITDFKLEGGGNLFTIDDSGNIRLTGEIDYEDPETPHEYNLTVIATNNDGIPAETDVHIDITDVNDAPHGLTLTYAPVTENAILHLDAQSASSNNKFIGEWEDVAKNDLISDNATHTASFSGKKPELNDGSEDGIGTHKSIDFADTKSGLSIGTGEINNGAESRSFAFEFETGASVDGTQVIYEEGGGWRGYNLLIVKGNLIAIAYDDNWGSDSNNSATSQGEFALINLGTVNSNSVHSVILDHNGTDGTFTAWLDGKPHTSPTTAPAMLYHGNTTGIGDVSGETIIPKITYDDEKNITDIKIDFADKHSDVDFQGEVGEIISWNQSLGDNGAARVQAYLEDRWSNQETSGDTTNFVLENAPVGTVVGTLQASDVDSDHFTYKIVDDSPFQIVGNQLRVNGEIDYEAANVTDGIMTIQVKVTDDGSKNGNGTDSTEPRSTTVSLDINIGNVVEDNFESFSGSGTDAMWTGKISGQGVHEGNLLFDDAQQLTIDVTQLTAGNQNSLGFYYLDENGMPTEAHMLFEGFRGFSTNTNNDIEVIGDNAHINVAAGDHIGFFLIPNSAGLPNGADISFGAPSPSGEPVLQYTDGEGTTHSVDTVYYVGDTGNEAAWNGGNEQGHSAMTSSDGTSLTIGIEDVAINDRDADFDEPQFTITTNDIKHNSEGHHILNGEADEVDVFVMNDGDQHLVINNFDADEGDVLDISSVLDCGSFDPEPFTNNGDGSYTATETTGDTITVSVDNGDYTININDGQNIVTLEAPSDIDNQAALIQMLIQNN